MLSQKAKQKTVMTSLPSRQLCELHHLFPRLLRQVHPGLSVSHEAMNVMDSFVKDIFEWIAAEARHLAIPTSTAPLFSGDPDTQASLPGGDLQVRPCLSYQVSHQIQNHTNKLPQDHLEHHKLDSFQTTHLEGKDL